MAGIGAGGPGQIAADEALVDLLANRPAPPPPRRSASDRRRLGRLGPNLLLVACAIFFLAPLLSMARSALQNVLVVKLGWSTLFNGWSFDSIAGAFKEQDFGSTLALSLRLALGTVLLTLALLIPTALLVHIKLPKARGMIEFMTLLPYMVPPIALVAGVIGFIRPHARWFIASNYSLIPFYAILALPFTYRSIDSGIRAIDVRTLIDASRSLGAGWGATLFRVLLPNLRSSVISSSFLTATVVLGEFTMAQVLLKRTFPFFLAQYGRANARGGLGLALMTLVFTTALLGLLTILTRRKGRGDSAIRF
jgi:putative spermidine/putrescine transport system permease protein